MTFAALETSRSRGQPRSLIYFTVGDDEYAYTDAEQPVTFDTVTYEPVSLDRDKVAASGNLDKSTMGIRLPTTTDIVELFRIFPPSQVVNVIIYQGHLGDGDWKVVFTGRVLGCSRAESVATLSCEPVSTSMRRPGLRRRYQRGCPHALYDDKCKLNRAAFTVNAVIADVDGAYLSFSNGWNGAFAAGRFEGGVLSVGGEQRTIVKVMGNTLLVSGVIPQLVSGVTAALSLGCPHTMDGCNAFSNILNYGGHPWIPSKSPFGQDNQFY